MKLSFFRERFSKGFFKDKYFLAIIALTLLGFTLRIYSLSSQSIWMNLLFLDKVHTSQNSVNKYRYRLIVYVANIIL